MCVLLSCCSNYFSIPKNSFVSPSSVPVKKHSDHAVIKGNVFCNEQAKFSYTRLDGIQKPWVMVPWWNGRKQIDRYNLELGFQFQQLLLATGFVDCWRRCEGHGQLTLRRMTAPPRPELVLPWSPPPVPLRPAAPAPGVRLRTASFSAKQAPRQDAGAPPGATAPTNDGSRSTALCAVAPMSCHASRRGRSGSTSLARNGADATAMVWSRSSSPRRRNRGREGGAAAIGRTRAAEAKMANSQQEAERAVPCRAAPARSALALSPVSSLCSLGLACCSARECGSRPVTEAGAGGAAASRRNTDAPALAAPRRAERPRAVFFFKEERRQRPARRGYVLRRAAEQVLLLPRCVRPKWSRARDAGGEC